VLEAPHQVVLLEEVLLGEVLLDHLQVVLHPAAHLVVWHLLAEAHHLVEAQEARQAVNNLLGEARPPLT